MAEFLRKEPCKKCISLDRDRAGDNLARYSDGSAHCFACGYTLLSEAYKIERGIINEETEEEEVMTKELITQEEAEQIKGYTSNKGKNLRGLTDETYKYYSVRTKYDEETGEPSAQYYPYTDGYKTCGYKVRELPKSFHIIGKVGSSSDLFGQWRHKNSNSKWVVLCAGEIDAMSAHQMLMNYNKSRGSDYEPVPCLSPSTGESGCKRQLQNQYDYLSKFDRIILSFDMDDAGQKAVEKIVPILPKGKVYIMSLCMKDTNEMLVNGKEKEWISSFFKAQKYTPAGIIGSDSIYQEIVERAKVSKLPFPPFLKKLNHVLAGGIPFGFIVNIIAGSGIGKSVFVNECLIYWAKTCNETVGVVSLEADAGAYGENILSRFVSKKISTIADNKEKLEFVTSQSTQDAAKELFTKDDGSPSFMLLDDRGDFDKLQEKIEELVISFGVRVILIDVISDVFSGMTIAEVDLWMKWEKNLVKMYNCILIQVAHTRKSTGGEKSGSQGAFLSEESTIGSGTQYRSAGINISLQRDKTAEDEDERNTTKVHLLKSRDTGWTGKVCEIFYEGDTHTLWDKEDYLIKVNPEGF